MKLKTLEVAVAGAGIGGLALATMLAREGCKVVVYDQMDAPRPVGSGFVLQPTGAAVLATMGLLDAVSARGSRIDRMVGRLKNNGRQVLDVRYRSGQSGLAVQRAALFNLLHEAALAAGVTFETAVRVAGVEDGDRPCFVFASGTTSAKADLLVDAMGASSPIAADARSELSYGALWATVPWPEGGPFSENLLEQRYFKASQMAGVLPVGTAKAGDPKMATFFWSLRNADHAAWVQSGKARWIDDVARLWPEAVPLASISEPIHARYRHQTRKPILGRHVQRIGDAWHATSPQLGQGANMALLDAVSLASALMREASLADAISRHIRQRQRHVQSYQFLSRVLTPFYQSDSQVLPILRDMGIAPMAGLPGIRSLVSSVVTGDLLNPVSRIPLLMARDNRS